MSNRKVLEMICSIMDACRPSKKPYRNLITQVKDRPGHDRRYAINSHKITKELGWKPQYSFIQGLEKTIFWYLENLDWCESAMLKSNYKGERLGGIS